ncbi:MAG: pyridoxal phosphate-dependent aminotransferase, partial [candidate division Zixibacteria bacterium]
NWTATGWMIRLAGGTLKFVKLRPELNYRWDIEEVKCQITTMTKAILINTPHNPTGGVMQRDDLEALLDLAEEYDLYIVSDEAYEDIIYDQQHISIASLAKGKPAAIRDRIITCYTFSKSYAMTGWRLGYAVSSSKAYHASVKKMILYTINGVSTPTQYGGIAALEGNQDCVSSMTAEYCKRRDLLFEGIKNTALLQTEKPPSGSFYLYAQITDAWKGSAWDLVNQLIDNYSMGSVPGDVFYDDQKAIRFSYACNTEMIEKAVTNLSQPMVHETA